MLDLLFVNNDEMVREGQTDGFSFLGKDGEEKFKEYVQNILENVFNVEPVNMDTICDICTEISIIINKYTFRHTYATGIVDTLISLSKKTDNKVIENAKNYIKEHYNEEITLNRLSKVLYIHPIYLSKLFKEKMRENFIDYLTWVRVEKSKKLLAELSLKIYEVSSMVGYNSSKHFSQLFKKNVGITPKEFREEMIECAQRVNY